MERGIVRKPKSNFTQVPNGLINDVRLKPQERFLYIYLISKPDGWVFHRNKVAKDMGVNKDTLSRYFQSICELGWIKKIQTRGSDGSFGTIIIDIYDNPSEAEKPIHGETEIEITDDGKHRDGKIDSRILYSNSNTDLNNKKEKKQSDFEKKSQRDIFESESYEVELWPTFEDFWSLYDKKTGKEKAQKKWEKLKQSEKEKIMEVLPDYVASTPDKNYRKNPETYLNGKHWNDEIIYKAKKMDAVDEILQSNGITLTEAAKMFREDDVTTDSTQPFSPD